MPYSVVFAAGSRADYGIMREYLRLLGQQPDVDLSVLVTGAMLEDKYGAAVKLVEEDGFCIACRVRLPLEGTENSRVVDCMAAALHAFGTWFAKEPCDLLILLGDRYEMLSVAVAAAMNRVPILHVHGGEATYANYDEFIRHCITKMSTYHFASTETYRKRIVQLGEKPSRVFRTGAFGAENCLSIKEENVPAEVKALAGERYFVVLFHPETISGASPGRQAEELLAALDAFPGYRFVFIGSNADTGSDIIRERVARFVRERGNAAYFENLHPDGYHFLLRSSLGLVGNSSSGIIEAPSLGIYTVNVGDRQAGRVKGRSVLSVPCERKAVEGAISRVLALGGRQQFENPYLVKDAARKSAELTGRILKRLKEDASSPKVFFDIPFSLREES